MQREREKEDARVLEEELATLAVGHRQRLSGLERELKQDAQNKRDAFEHERVRISVQQVPLRYTYRDNISRGIRRIVHVADCLGDMRSRLK